MTQKTINVLIDTMARKNVISKYSISIKWDKNERSIYMKFTKNVMKGSYGTSCWSNVQWL